MTSAGLPSRRVVRLTLWVLAAAGLLVPILTLRWFPTPFADLQLYASIAISRHRFGIGVPSITWNSPAAVDHIPFYGPVFFDLAAVALRVFDVRLVSFRLVSIAGTLLYLAATLLLTRQFTRSIDRMLLAAVLVLLMPEVNFGMAAGAMHMLAVAFEVLALAAFVKNFDRRRGGAGNGLAAGLCLSLAALTTPRSYPFVCAFACAALVPSIFGTARAAIRYRFAAAMVVLIAVMAGWAVIAHGSVAAWLNYMAYIAMHEDTDVAVLPTAVRRLSFHWSALLLPMAVTVFGALAAWSMRRRLGPLLTGAAAGREASRDGALSFLIACAWIALVITAVVLNYTFATNEYTSLPLFAVVVAWPWDAFAVPRRRIALLTGVLLTIEVGLMVRRYTMIAVRWDALDPAPLNAFVARYVPAGSAVVGTEEPFLFPVERSGSIFRTQSPRSWADWARWVPAINPAATRLARSFPQPRPRDRFLIWPTGDDVPPGYECALGSVVARFTPAPPDPRWPEWIVRASNQYAGYPAATLYRLPDGCPSGYDPTRKPGPPRAAD